MAKEDFNYINSLEPLNPESTDPVSEGDDHIRGIKKTLKDSFPNVDSAVNAIHTGDTEPANKSAGQIWFDTSSGMIKFRNSANTEWIPFSAEGSTGTLFGAKITHLYANPGGFRNYEDDPHVTAFNYTPHRGDSRIEFDLAFSCGHASYGVRSELRHRIVYSQGDVEDRLFVSSAGDEFGTWWSVGFNHVSDSGNFEIYSNASRSFFIDGQDGNEMTIKLLSWGTDPAGDAGSQINAATLKVMEYV